jgi:3-oxoacyl-[acyl-carrier protein] reductase
MTSAADWPSSPGHQEGNYLLSAPSNFELTSYSSIGAACARQLAEKGVHLALTYSSNLTAITTLTDELKSQSPDLRISIHKVDVGVAEQIESMFLEIDKAHGQRPDILVSNAGYGKRVPQVWDITLEEFDYTITVNLRASFILVKGVVEHMKGQRWGRIVFMSSIAGYGGGINGARTSFSSSCPSSNNLTRFFFITQLLFEPL